MGTKLNGESANSRAARCQVNQHFPKRTANPSPGEIINERMYHIEVQTATYDDMESHELKTTRMHAGFYTMSFPVVVVTLIPYSCYTCFKETL
jgi:myosin-crossreactive antigen